MARAITDSPAVATARPSRREGEIGIAIVLGTLLRLGKTVLRTAAPYGKVAQYMWDSGSFARAVPDHR